MNQDVLIRQKLPNATGILVLGISSIVLSCCCSGLFGLITGIIALVLAGQDKATYNKFPDQYTGYDNVKTGRLLAIIGIILSVIFILVTVYMISTFGLEGIQEMQEEIFRELNIDLDAIE